MREQIVGHIVTIQESVGVFSREFQHKLRRSNYVTPKNYLDFINTYLRLLDENDTFILNQVSPGDLLRVTATCTVQFNPLTPTVAIWVQL